MLLFSFYCDYLYYGKFTLVSLNFLNFNVLSGGADYFGTEPFLTYFTLFLPLQLNAFYPFMFLGAKELLWDSKTKKLKFDPLAITAVTYLLTISLI